tara:strand:- start:262 stop:633 length:372 start_codon:yes stop_codon:yes gene_type:complete
MVGVNIGGPRGGKVREEDKIFDFVNVAIDILGLEKYDFGLEIIVSNQFEEGFSDAVGACYGDTEEICVELARKDWDGQKQEILKVLAHEMIHVRQCAKGEYMYENPARKHEEFLFDLVMERLV